MVDPAVVEFEDRERMRHAIRAAVEFLDDLEVSGIVDEWHSTTKSGFYMTYGMLKEVL